LPKFWQVVPPSEADSPEANPDAVAEKELSPVH
jgi:glutamate synthase (ferredoxin)